MTDCFSKNSDLKGNIHEIWKRRFNCGSFIMQVNLMHAHCSAPRRFFHALSPLAVVKSTYTIKTDPKIQIIIWLNSFLTFKKFYLSAFRCVQSLICWVFGRFVKFKNIVAILKNNSAIYQKSSIKIIPIGIGTNNSVRSANISCLPRKPLFEVQFLMTCDSYL